MLKECASFVIICMVEANMLLSVSIFNWKHMQEDCAISVTFISIKNRNKGNLTRKEIITGRNDSKLQIYLSISISAVLRCR